MGKKENQGKRGDRKKNPNQTNKIQIPTPPTPLSKRLFFLVSESMFLEKRSLALGLEYIMANSLCLYSEHFGSGVLTAGEHRENWSAHDRAWRQHHSCDAGNSKLYDKGQHRGKLRIEDVCWSKRFGKQRCSLQPCSF